MSKILYSNPPETFSFRSFDANWTRSRRCCTRTSSRSTPATPPTSRGRIQSSSERCVSMSRSLCAGLIRVSSTHALYSSPLINRTFSFLLFDASLCPWWSSAGSFRVCRSHRFVEAASAGQVGVCVLIEHGTGPAD